MHFSVAREEKRPPKVAQVAVCRRSEHRDVYIGCQHQRCLHYCFAQGTGSTQVWEMHRIVCTVFSLWHINLQSPQYCWDKWTGATLLKCLRPLEQRMYLLSVTMYYWPLDLTTTQWISSSLAQICSTYNPKPECIETRRIRFCLPRQEGLNVQCDKNTYLGTYYRPSLTFHAGTQTSIVARRLIFIKG